MGKFNDREYLISSLKGMTLRLLVELRGLQSDLTRILEAEPGKHDIKRHEPGILFISYQLLHSTK